MRTFATVDSTPLVSLGGSGATGATHFDEVMSVRIGARGRIWVGGVWRDKEDVEVVRVYRVEPM